MQRFLSHSIFAVGLLFPGLLFAAPANLGGVIQLAIGLINPLIGLLTGLAVLAFVWGIVKYIAAAGDGKGKEDSRKMIIYGVIGLFVLFSFWGIVRFITTDIFG